jgi:hypothetical protein
MVSNLKVKCRSKQLVNLQSIRNNYYTLKTNNFYSMPLIYSMTLIYLSFLNKKLIGYLIMNTKQYVNS